MKTNKNISAIATMKKKQLIDKEGASLIRALIIISIIGLLAMFTNKASAQVRFHAGQICALRQGRSEGERHRRRRQGDHHLRREGREGSALGQDRR